MRTKIVLAAVAAFGISVIGDAAPASASQVRRIPGTACNANSGQISYTGVGDINPSSDGTGTTVDCPFYEEAAFFKQNVANLWVELDFGTHTGYTAQACVHPQGGVSTSCGSTVTAPTGTGYYALKITDLSQWTSTNGNFLSGYAFVLVQNNNSTSAILGIVANDGT